MSLQQGFVELEPLPKELRTELLALHTKVLERPSGGYAVHDTEGARARGLTLPGQNVFELWGDDVAQRKRLFKVTLKKEIETIKQLCSHLAAEARLPPGSEDHLIEHVDCMLAHPDQVSLAHVV